MFSRSSGHDTANVDHSSHNCTEGSSPRTFLLIRTKPVRYPYPPPPELLLFTGMTNLYQTVQHTEVYGRSVLCRSSLGRLHVGTPLQFGIDQPKLYGVVQFPTVYQGL